MASTRVALVLVLLFGGPAAADEDVVKVRFAVADRVYDGTADATSLVTITNNPVHADGSTVRVVSASFDSGGDAGDGKSLSITFDFATNNGAHELVNPASTASTNITPRPLMVTAMASDKDRDGSTSAAVTLADDRLLGDSVILSFAEAVFADRFPGTNKTVAVSGIAIVGGSDAPNYSLSDSATMTNADIRGTLALDAGLRVWASPSGVQLRGGPTTYLIAAELTGDDLTDVVNVTTNGAQILRNDGGVGTDLELTLTQELDVRWSKGGNAIDVDDDGDLDLVLGDVEHVKIAINDGTGLFVLNNAFRHGFRQPTVAEPFNSHANPLHPNNEVRIAVSSSSDGNVHQDQIGRSTDGGPNLYVMQPDGGRDWRVLATLDSFNVDGLVAHDHDRDGFTDLFVSNRSGAWSMRPVYVYTGSAGGYSGDGSVDLLDVRYPFSFGSTDRVAETNFGAPRRFAGFAVGSWHGVSVWSGSFGSWNTPLHVTMDPESAGGFEVGEAWGSAFADMNADGFVDLVAVGRTAPLAVIRLDLDPNAAPNRYTASLLDGTSHDVKIRDFDTDSNDAPDVIVGRSDGVWYYHNPNGADAGGGSLTPPAPPPTGGEYLSTAIDHLYEALDPHAANPIESDDPVRDNGTADTYYNGAAVHAGLALGRLNAVHSRFRAEVPNFVFGDRTKEQIETLRQYHAYAGEALVELAAADGLTSNASDESTLASLTSTLLAAQADIVAQAQELGGVESPFKRAELSRRLARERRKAVKAQYAMLESMAAARNATNLKQRARLVRRADRQGRRSLRHLQRFHARADR